MQHRIFRVFAMVCLLGGCVASGLRVNDEALHPADRLAVVAIEAPPLTVTPKLNTVVFPGMVRGSGGGALLFGILFATDAPRAIKEAEAASKSIEELLSKTEPWLPTSVLAEEVRVQLTEKQHRHVVVDPAVQFIPGVKKRTYTLFMENWMGPIRDWYNSSPSEVNYGGVPEDVVAVLEIGVLNYEVTGNTLLLQVLLRLVDPETKEVLGRARSWKQIKIGRPEEAFANEAEIFKERFAYWGSQLVANALIKMNLVHQ
jgi:hypothetical protein